jgi:hypothetical protein
MNGEPHVSWTHGRSTLEWGDPERAVLDLDYIRSDRGDITAEVSATSTVPTGGLVHVARVNLLSTRSLAEYAGHVARRAPQTSTDWQRLLAIAARETVTRHRRGEPAVLLRDVGPAEDDGYALAPLTLARMPTGIHGDGGAGKSVIALAAAASINSGVPYLGLEPSTVTTVGYLDWEMDGHEHRDRLARICGGDEMPGIVYIPCARPLADDVDRIRREVIRHGIGYLVVDSVALACDGPPEAAEVAVRFFGALRELGLGSLLVAHVNRAGDTDRPFGSAFWHNGLRLTWYAKLEADGGGSTTVGLFAKKANTGPKPPPLGFRIDWGERITFTRTDVRNVEDFAAHVPVRFRMQAEIVTGAKTIAEIAAALDVSVDTVKKAVDRDQESARPMFARVLGGDGVYRVGLAA